MTSAPAGCEMLSCLTIRHFGWHLCLGANARKGGYRERVINRDLSSRPRITPGGDRQRAAQLAHLGGTQGASEAPQLAPAHREEIAQVDAGCLLPTLLHADGHLRRSAAHCGRHRSPYGGAVSERAG